MKLCPPGTSISMFLLKIMILILTQQGHNEQLFLFLFVLFFKLLEEVSDGTNLV